MKRLSFYLAHPVDSRHRIREWEIEFEKRTGIELFNPFYDAKRKDVLEIDSGTRKRGEGMTVEKADSIVNKDLKKIVKSTGITAIIDGSSSYGTIQEIVYAYLLNKPVYSLITNGKEKDPWLMYHSTKIFTKREELEEFLIELKNN